MARFSSSVPARVLSEMYSSRTTNLKETLQQIPYSHLSKGAFPQISGLSDSFLEHLYRMMVFPSPSARAGFNL